VRGGKKAKVYYLEMIRMLKSFQIQVPTHHRQYYWKKRLYHVCLSQGKSSISIPIEEVSFYCSLLYCTDGILLLPSFINQYLST
jgi:hypothetical protein